MLANRYRSGPWPGLTAMGAAVLLACAGLLFGSEAVPAATLLPLALATWIVRAPGAASAVTGAYLLPRTVWSLVDPGVPLPALLLVPALAFDVAAWLRTTDVRALVDIWPARRKPWRIRTDRSSRRVTWRRLALAGLAFEGTLLAVEPAWRSFLGASS